MERKFYPENFERFLKGHADQFKMTPSKKVWHGIYNDLHPGRRWPSIAMSMVFIFTLVIIGHLNTNNGNNTSLNNLTSLPNSNIINSAKTTAEAKDVKKGNTKNIVQENNLTENTSDANDLNTSPILSVIKDNDLSSNPIANSSESKADDVILKNKNENPFSDKIENRVIQISQTDDKAINITDQENLNQITEDKESVNTTTSKEITVNEETISSIPPQTSETNIKKARKINNVTWTYYVSPSISYRSLSDDQINNSVTHKPRIGYEAGTSMSFNIYKKLQLTTGLQVNYSGYNIQANNVHPTLASLVLNSETAGQYNVYSTISYYGNRTGAEFTKLKNYNLQASIPIGLQYSFAGNDNIKFGAAASFQPSFIIASQAYLLSQDKRNYLTDQELYRKWNMNTHFTTYVSFSSNSLNWQIGPQVRYQLLSTYTNRYQLKENLINYGIRIGISKISK